MSEKLSQSQENHQENQDLNNTATTEYAETTESATASWSDLENLAKSSADTEGIKTTWDDLADMAGKMGNNEATENDLPQDLSQKASETLKKGSFLRGFIDRMRKKKIERDIDTINRLQTGSRKEQSQLLRMVAKGRIKLSEPALAEAFLSNINDVSKFELERFEKLGLSKETIENNENVQKKTIKKFLEYNTELYSHASVSEDLSIKWEFSSDILRNAVQDKERVKVVLEEINTSRREAGLEDLDIQEMGERALEHTIERSKYSENVSEDKKRIISENMDLYGKLGFVPYSTSESIDKLLQDRRAQDFLVNADIMNGDIADKLYEQKIRAKFSKILDKEAYYENGYYDKSYVISPNVEPSGKNKIVTYWTDQSEALGEDAVSYVVSALQSNFKLSEEDRKTFLNEDLTLADDFFTRKDSYGEPLNSDFTASSVSYGLARYYDHGAKACARFMLHNKDMLDETDAKFATIYEKLTELDNPESDDAWKMSRVFCHELDPNLREGKSFKDHLDEQLKYFDESGVKPAFWDKKFDEGNFDFLISQSEKTKNSMPFDERERAILDAYSKCDRRAESVFIDFIKDNRDISIDQIEILDVTLKKLLSSNAGEISSHISEFTGHLLTSGSVDEISENLNKIEDIFIHNNLPYSGKVFKTFRVLYPEGRYNPASPAMERGDLRGLPESGFFSKNLVLFNDLLKATLGSNNRDMKKYLQSLADGEELSERVNSGETDFTPEEMDTLRAYAGHLVALYNETEASKKEPAERSDDCLQDIRDMSAKFSATERYSVPDRVVRSFGFGLHIRSLEAAQQWMDRAVRDADARNREAAKHEFKLESGDLIKSTGIEYLGDILQNGAVCKEFLNGQAETDGTPLDADLNVLPEGLSGNISEGVDKKNEIAAFGTMHCMMVMKGDENSGRHRFKMEEEGGGYDSGRYEVWHNGGDNYGIRVGFPSSEIDYLIYDDLGSPSEGHDDFETMKFEVARNGFYIPIVDKTSGELIFSPDEYDSMRQKMAGLKTIEAGAYHFADEHNWSAGRVEAVAGSGDQLVANMNIGDYQMPDGTVIEGTDTIMANLARNHEEVDRKRNAIINEVVMPVLEEFGLDYKPYLDGDLSEGSVEMIDTGSTGRYANAPGDGDFDFMIKLDKNDYVGDRLSQVRNAMVTRMGGNVPLVGENI
ncbi:hypothetical protein IJ135_01720, partial [Candidatus Saccharibacteria bacterium]|nr:hypothetical protein [Candidatus Saccharibacteria bacterium]